MKIKVNPDTNTANEIRKQIKDNNGYCPCSLVKTPETKCICKRFIEQESGMCHCGLYIKEQD